MDYRILKLSQLVFPNPIDNKTITIIWGNDGWRYIPDLKIRDKFTQTKYYMETWEGVIALPEHVENINWTLYSHQPRLWKEGEEVYEEKVSNQIV